MADLRPTSQNGSWSQVDDPVYLAINRCDSAVAAVSQVYECFETDCFLPATGTCRLCHMTET
jgi:hypothetical protein